MDIKSATAVDAANTDGRKNKGASDKGNRTQARADGQAMKAEKKPTRAQLEINALRLEVLKLSETLSKERKEHLDLVISQQETINNMFRIFLDGGNAGDVGTGSIYRELARKYHPDRNSDTTFGATEVMSDINRLRDETMAVLTMGRKNGS